ncbi:DNA-methyltransferase [Herpetosiphon geysericola]|uniref:DNA-methyltransferase n=1 Tax=Herpetosiphon geysericola TaxID=70996 RepID=UPI0006C93177|nr:DNA methyltransferase [Herpetosiphon geysericola]
MSLSLPKPFYQDDFVTIYNADCRDVLPALEDRAIGVTITDPPYESEAHTKQVNLSDHLASKKTTRIEQTDLAFAPITPELRDFVAKQVARVTQRWSLTFCQAEALHLWRDAYQRYGHRYIRTGIWIKLGAQPQTTGDRPAQGFEPFVIHHQPQRPRWNGGGKSAIYSHAVNKARKKTDHKTKKPLDLMKELVALYTDRDELILDCFAGSGQTGIAAKLLQRRCILIEQDLQWCTRMAVELTKTHPTMGLIDFRAIRKSQQRMEVA